MACKMWCWVTTVEGESEILSIEESREACEMRALKSSGLKKISSRPAQEWEWQCAA
jgi:hypothetical protein